MPARPLDAQIDRLYQLSLDEFTAARNALAKEVGKDGGAEVKALQKPPVAAWALNQVYWQHRPAYHALEASAAALKTAHAAVLGGKRADLRAAGQAHEEALEAVLKTALAILERSGQPATDATKQAIATTLRALPGSTETPGRLTRTLQPGGFELLAGLPGAAAASARPQKAAAPREREPAPARAPESRTKDAARAKAIAKAKETVAAATRKEREAEQVAKRDEFEAAKTARDAERATARLEDARATFDKAQAELNDGEEEAGANARKRDTGDSR